MDFCRYSNLAERQLVDLNLASKGLVDRFLRGLQGPGSTLPKNLLVDERQLQITTQQRKQLFVLCCS
jgi:hypothetical protein